MILIKQTVYKVSPWSEPNKFFFLKPRSWMHATHVEKTYSWKKTWQISSYFHTLTLTQLFISNSVSFRYYLLKMMQSKIRTQKYNMYCLTHKINITWRKVFRRSISFLFWLIRADISPWPALPCFAKILSGIFILMKFSWSNKYNINTCDFMKK